MATSNFGKKLAEIMGKRQLTTSDLSRKSGIPYQMIDGYLKGNTRGSMPSLPTLLALARALPATLEELTGLESLHDAEKRIPELTPDALKFGKFYESLPDGDPLKEYLRKMIEQKSDSSETDKENDTNPK